MNVKINKEYENNLFEILWEISFIFEFLFLVKYELLWWRNVVNFFVSVYNNKIGFG